MAPVNQPMSTVPQTPERSQQQRMDALRRANDIRSERARLKEALRNGDIAIVEVLSDPPSCVATAKVLDLLLAVPKYGRVKANKLLERCRVSSVQDGQRPDASPAQGTARHAGRLTGSSSLGAVIARLIVISGPSGAGKGTLIRNVLPLCPRPGRVRLGYHPAPPAGRGGGPGLLLPQRGRVQETGSSEGEFLEWAEYAGHSLRDARAGGRRRTSTAGRDVILEIELEGAAQVLAKRPDALMIFIMPPSLRGVGAAAGGAQDRDQEAIRAPSGQGKGRDGRGAERRCGRRRRQFTML